MWSSWCETRDLIELAEGLESAFLGILLAFGARVAKEIECEGTRERGLDKQRKRWIRKR